MTRLVALIVLAASLAHAVPMGARVTAWGGGWTNPYITDGLVAMWDGEWNAGPGVHDANATVWKDLSGHGYDFRLDSSFVIGDRSVTALCSYPSGAKVSSVDIGVLDVSTVEITASAAWKYSDNYASLQRILYISSGSGCPAFRFRGASIHNGPGVSLVTFSPSRYYAYIGHPSLTGSDPVYMAVAGQSYYVNGSVTTLASNFNDVLNRTGVVYLNRSTRSDVTAYSVRIYNRALTSEEIAHNYAVDKARFGLP